MSIVKDYLTENLLPYFCKESVTFDPLIQCIYLTEEGWIDKGTIMRETKQHMSVNSFRKLLKEVFGYTSFNLHKIQEDNLTKEEFDSIYEFGKHPFGRGWIKEVYEKTGKLVTINKIYGYIT